jgi:hypothetical protein
MKPNHGAHYEILIGCVLRTYRDRQDIALHTARLMKSRNPHSVVKLKELGRPARRPSCRSSRVSNPDGKLPHFVMSEFAPQNCAFRVVSPASPKMPRAARTAL